MSNNPFLIYNEHNAPITPGANTIRIVTSTQSESGMGPGSPTSPSTAPKRGLYALEAELDAMLHPKSPTAQAQEDDLDSPASYHLSEKEIVSSPQIHVWAAETQDPPKSPVDSASSSQRSTKLTRLFTRSRGSTRRPKQTHPASASPQFNAPDAEWEKQAETLALFEPPATSPPNQNKIQARLSIFGSKTSAAHASPRNLSRSSSPVGPTLPSKEATTQNLALTFSQSTDQRLQEAIELHDAGDLSKSTAMLEELADPASINHPLAQVLFGLACRHGWGVPVNEERAFRYIRLAAGNSALVDQILSSSGNPTPNSIKPSAHNKSKSGFAKGELVLSIYELGNCFRYGWGTARDPVLAKQYYETAARLGDVDAMLECAWCYMTGFGIRKKDKYAAAQYYRMAEKAGRVEVGNSWIWYVYILQFSFFCHSLFLSRSLSLFRPFASSSRLIYTNQD